MAAITANAKNFLLNTDYPLDKVVLLKEGQVTIAAFDFVDLAVPHGLSFTPLVLGSWTTDSTWAVSYEMNSSPFAGAGFLYQTSTDANSTNLYFHVNNNTGSSVTMYYRFYCMEPSNVNVDIAPTNSGVNNFMLNTDSNYTKLLTSGIHTEPSTGGASVARTIAHNLGYVPQVAVWFETGGLINPVTFAQPSISPLLVETTSSVLTLRFKTSVTTSAHYRIYLDEQL